MNGNKGEEKGMMGFCCGHGKRTLSLGVILFVLGILMQNRYTVPEIVEITGAMIIISSLISMLLHRGK